MTIVAFLKESDDSLLLAADSRFTDGDIRMTKSKLRRANKEQIAWSGSGNPSISLDEFGLWINGYDFHGENWALFAKAAIDTLSKLNGAQRERTKLSGVKWNKNFAADILIVGWIGGEMGAYALSSDGRYHNVLQNDFEAIGTGCKMAKIAMWTAELCGKGQTKFDIFKTVMRVVAEHAQDCCLPVEACRLKREDIEPAFSFGV